MWGTEMCEGGWGGQALLWEQRRNARAGLWGSGKRMVVLMPRQPPGRLSAPSPCLHAHWPPLPPQFLLLQCCSNYASPSKSWLKNLVAMELGRKMVWTPAIVWHNFCLLTPLARPDTMRQPPFCGCIRVGGDGWVGWEQERRQCPGLWQTERPVSRGEKCFSSSWLWLWRPAAQGMAGFPSFQGKLNIGVFSEVFWFFMCEWLFFFFFF